VRVPRSKPVKIQKFVSGRCRVRAKRTTRRLKRRKI